MSGVHAIVRCRCWAEGRTGEPPVSRELIDDSDRYGLNLVSWVQEGRAELARRLRDWVDAEACPHESMQVHHEFVGTWEDLDLFAWAVESVGAARLPILSSLHVGSESCPVLPADALLALAELDVLGAWPEFGRRDALFDEATGRCLVEAAWHLGPGTFATVDTRLVFDADGMFVSLDRGTRRAGLGRRVRQEQVGDQWWLVPDTPDADLVQIPGPVHGGAAVIVQRPMTYRPDDLHQETLALREAFETAAEVGNPVLWAF